MVSLVPSLTESVAVSAPEILVGATDWCTHPLGLDVARVRGTKNPNKSAIAALRPDLVLANKEENRRVDVDAIRAAGIAVWVTAIETVDQAITSLGRLFTQALQRPIPGWLEEAGRVWSTPVPPPAGRVVVPIWRDPWMVVGSATFAGDLVAHLGLDNVYGNNADRYPHVELSELQGQAPDLVLLPDEPYRFTAQDGPESFPGCAVALVEGRSLTWYGPSLAAARDLLSTQIQQALSS
ncbi:MAG: putative extracellular metal binding protein [Mycobacterium sp.]|nr:putative extracellular metal binding protein [Mycobacterium sp.]